jgi:hypothetical protein
MFAKTIQYENDRLTIRSRRTAIQRGLSVGDVPCCDNKSLRT